MVGTHLLKCWSSTQAGVAMSSGEAEFYGAVKGAAAGLGMKALYRDNWLSTATETVDGQLGSSRYLQPTRSWQTEALGVHLAVDTAEDPTR